MAMVAADGVAPTHVDEPMPWLRHEVVAICPVCPRIVRIKTSQRGVQHYAEFVAVSSRFETNDGQDLYVVTCDRHSLADIHAMVHGKRHDDTRPDRA